MAFMRPLPLRNRQERCKNIHLRKSLLVMFALLQTLMLAPKQVLTFLIPKTMIMQRKGVTHKEYYTSSVNSIQQLQYNRNRCHPMSLLRLSSSSTSNSDDGDTNKSVTTTASTETSEKYSAELEAVQAAREARKYVWINAFFI